MFQLQTSLDEFAAEATKERKLRECSEVSIQQLEAELEKLKSRDSRAPDGAASIAELQQEITRSVPSEKLPSSMTKVFCIHGRCCDVMCLS